ncbi:MAG: LPS export ABC transporter permease LptG [candidate division KSB1 bacterium]|nr:LPS export ABC transporter permease LptG [candidate division KSB1 bacterium]
MRILDRYIALKFVGIFVFAIFAFLSIFVIVDLIENLDDFIKNDASTRITVLYYFYYLPFIFVLILPVTSLLSSLFSVGTLARQNEIVAMKAAGISLYRILAPLLILGILISVLSLGVANYFLPGATERQNMIERVHLNKRKNVNRISNVWIKDDSTNRISMRYFDVIENTGNVVSIRRFEGRELRYRLDARKIIWKDSVWVLYNGFERYFQKDQETAISFNRKVFEKTTLRPENIKRMTKSPEAMSYAELKAFIQEVKRNGGDPDRWLVDLYLKLALPFANFIIILFGAPLSSSQTYRSGNAKGFGISLGVTFVYFGILKTTQALGHTGALPPGLAAWFANIVFGLLGGWVLFKAKK